MNVFVVVYTNKGVIKILSSKKKAEEYIKKEVANYLRDFQVGRSKEKLKLIGQRQKEEYQICKVKVD